MKYVIGLIVLTLLLAGCSGGETSSDRVVLDIPACYNECEEVFPRPDQDAVRHICKVACHQDAAEASGDYADCDPIKELGAAGESQSVNYIVCIQQLAEQNRDIEACDLIEGFILQANCIEEIARAYDDPSACDAIDLGEPLWIEGFKENCRKKVSR